MSRPSLTKPIAWTSSRDGGRTWVITESDPTDVMPDGGGIVHSLHTDNQLRRYADACVAVEIAQPKAVPLTDEQLLQAIASLGVEGQGRVALTYKAGPGDIEQPTVVAMLLARAIERAHGIGEAKP